MHRRSLPAAPGFAVIAPEQGRGRVLRYHGTVERIAMPDIELRFHKDMLVLSGALDEALARQGAHPARDRQYLNLLEPDVMCDALRLELMAGAQCLVTPTEDITRARLAHLNMSDSADRLAKSALDIAAELRPQHVLVEIGPCGLPLDPSSKASLNENRGQYADAARAFGDGAFDAFFLNGFTSIADLKCALMGVAQVSGKPVFASVVVGGSPEENAVGTTPKQARDDSEDTVRVLRDIARSYPLVSGGFELVDEAGSLPVAPAGRTFLNDDELPDAVDAMVDLGAAVIGFETTCPLADAERFARVIAGRTELPILAQLRVAASSGTTVKPKGLVPVEDMDEYTPDTLERAAVRLYAAGVQFLRVTGACTPAFTGALAATVAGLDVRR